MSELLDQINTDTNKEAISVKEITKALESWFFDAQENIATMIQELDHIDNNLERSCVQSLLKVAYTQPLYDKLQQYPELMQRLQVWSQEQYVENLSFDEKKIGWLSFISVPKKSEDVTITTLSKYINTANILPEHHDMLVKVLQEQIKLLNQLCPDKKSLLDMTWNNKKNWLDAPVLKIKTLQQLSDHIKKEAQVRKEYETIKSTSLKQIDPSQLSKDVLKLWTIAKLSTLPTELAKLDTESAFAQFLQKNQNDVLYWPILQQYVSIRLQPYIRKEGPVEYVSAAIDTENPELIAYVRGTIFWKKYLGETASAYKNYKEQQQNLAKFHLTWATADQIATFQRKRNNHQARVKPEYLKKIQDEEDRFNHESVMRHSQSTRDSMPYIKKWSVDKYIYDSVLTLTKDYVTLLLQTPEGKKLLKEKKYIDNPFMPGMRLNFAKGNVESIVRDSFFEKFGDGIDDFKKAWEEGRREEVGRSIGSLVWGTVAAGATTILTWWSGIWAAGAAFTVWSRVWWSLWGMIWAGFEGKSWSEIGNAWLVWLWVGERDQNGTFVNYFKDAKGNVTQDSLLHGTWRMGISLGTDYLSSVATFGIGNKIWLDKWAGKFVGAWWKQFASQGAVFGAEELFIENFLVDIPANTLQAWVSSFFLGNAIQDVWPRSAKLSQNTNTNKQIDPNNPTTTQWDMKAALGAMATTFSQNISPENLWQTFAATLAYGGMLSWGRSAINKVAVALPALSVKNINELSTSYQSHLSDMQTKFPTLQFGKDMKSLTLDGKVLDQTHPRFGELEWSLKALQVLGTSFTEEMDKISQIQQWLTDPQSPEAKKRWLIYGWKLLHPRMTPLEVMNGRINKLKKEITTEKNATTKLQKEALLQQMEKVKGEIEGKSNFNVEEKSKNGNSLEKNQIIETKIDQNLQNFLENNLLENKNISISLLAELYWKSESEIHQEYDSVNRHVQEVVKKWTPYIRANSDNILSILLGWFQTQFFTNTSWWLLDHSKRISRENLMFWFWKETPLENRPIYWYWSDSNPFNHAENYGNIVFELKGEIIDHVTLTWDDSLSGNLTPVTPFSDNLIWWLHGVVVSKDRMEKLKNASLINEITYNSSQYLEFQHHWNLSANNIKAIHIPSWLKLDNQILELCKKNNIAIIENQIDSTMPSINIQPLLTTHPDLLKNIVNPETLQNIIQSEMSAWNLILNTDGSIKEVYTEVNGEKKPSQLFVKMKADWFSEQQALKTWLQVRTPEFKNRFGDRQHTDKSQVSKVVDEHGEPLVVYHGSRTEIQDGIFKLPKDLEKTKTPMEWISTTSSKQVAIDYANKYHHNFEWGIVYPNFVNIKNSVSLDHVWEYNSYMKYLRKAEWLSEKYNIKSYEELKEFEHHMTSNTNEYLSQNEVHYKWNIFTKEEFIELWWMWFDLLLFVPNNKDNNYGLKNSIDGITFNPHIDWNFSAATSVPYDQQLIFDPKNIKSAINNDWSFSPETAKFNDYFWKESRFWFDSKQAIDHSTFMDQFSGQATPEQIAQIRQQIEAVAQMYAYKTWKKLELTDTQIQVIIDTHLLPWQLWKLTQAELLVKNKKLAEAIPDTDLRRFLLEAGFCGMFDGISKKIANLINKDSSPKNEILNQNLSSFTDLGMSWWTNWGKRYMNKENWEKYFIKDYNNIDQWKSEYISNELYKAVWIPVVSSDILDQKYIANKEIQWTHDITSVVDIKEWFVLDCILANWDATIYGNLIQTEDNKVYRIDNGWSLFFRAQWWHKDSFNNERVDEINSLRNPQINNTAAKYFSTITDNDIVQQIQKINNTLTDSKIKEIVNKSNISNSKDIVDIIIKRRNWLYEKYASKNIESLNNKIDELKNKKYNSRLEFEHDFNLLDYSSDAIRFLFNERITKDRIIEKIKSDAKIELLIEKGLTKEEALSVYRYTASWYKMVNNYNRDLFEKGIKALWSLEAESLLTWEQLIEIKILSYYIEQWLHKLPDLSVEGVKELQWKYDVGEKKWLLFRNLWFSSIEEVNQFINKCVDDGYLSDPWFISTSIKPKNFDAHGYKVALIIENGYNGKYIADYSHSWTELEVLFPPNTIFKMKGKPVKDKSWTWVIHLIGG